MVLAVVVAMAINLVVVVALNHVMTAVVMVAIVIVVVAVLNLAVIAVVIVLALVVTIMKAVAIVTQRRVKRIATPVHTQTVLQGLNLTVKDPLATAPVALVTVMATAAMQTGTAARHLTVVLVTALHLVKNHFRVMIKTVVQTTAATVVKVIAQMQTVAMRTVY